MRSYLIYLENTYIKHLFLFTIIVNSANTLFIVISATFL